MKTTEICKKIVEELGNTLSGMEEESEERFVEAILSAEKVFVAGAGRSLLMIRAFAMRLMQLGFQAYVVGETVTPAIGERDLLIIASGSGETGTLIVMADRAKKARAKLAAVTIYPESTIGRRADYIIQIRGTTMTDRRVHSVQPGAAMFEQSMLIFYDAVIVRIIQKCHIEEENRELKKRHANLE